MDENYRPPAHYRKTATSKGIPTFQEIELNNHLNSNKIWLGWRGKRPAPDEKIKDTLFMGLVLRSFLLSGVLVYTYLHVMNNVLHLFSIDPEYFHSSATVLSAGASTLVALWTTTNLAAWNARAEALKQEGKSALERFYLSRSVTPNEWRKMVASEPVQIAVLTQSDEEVS